MGLTLGLIPGAWPVYGPEGEGPFPGAVILHGAEGPGAGWSHRFAAILAAHGMLALPVAYGEGDVFGAGPIREVDLRPVEEAGRALAADPRCREVGLLGWSMGGQAALLVAALGGAASPFARVAAHAPPDPVAGAVDPAAVRAGAAPDPAAPPAWRWSGEEAALAPGRPVPVERIACPAFLSVGTRDEIVGPAAPRALAARLAAAGRPADLFLAEGQGHALDLDSEPELWRRLLAFFGAAPRAT